MRRTDLVTWIRDLKWEHKLTSHGVPFDATTEISISQIDKGADLTEIERATMPPACAVRLEGIVSLRP